MGFHGAPVFGIRQLVDRRHPGDFLRYYIWPNLINYYVPDPEFLATYNMGRDTVEQVAKAWFGYKTNKVSTWGNNKRTDTVKVFTIFLSVIYLLFVLSLTGFLLLDGPKKVSPGYMKTAGWAAVVWAGNCCFSVLASPIVLRYQVFPMIITLTVLSLLLAFLIRESRVEQAGQSVLSCEHNDCTGISNYINIRLKRKYEKDSYSIIIDKFIRLQWPAKDENRLGGKTLCLHSICCLQTALRISIPGRYRKGNRWY